MSLLGKWIDWIYKTATGDMRMKWVLTPVIGTLYLGLIALCLLLSFLTDELFGFRVSLSRAWTMIVGWPLVVSGFVLMVFSMVHFIRVKGTPVPFNPPPVLVTTGPYAFARNPMLTGIFMQMFGAGMLFHSPSMILIFTPLFIALNIWELKKVEEPELARRLGRDYTEYKDRVPMFFPWL
jgi:protein-S-isoprenylcysteine O-methyltransferase Ste14